MFQDDEVFQPLSAAAVKRIFEAYYTAVSASPPQLFDMAERRNQAGLIRRVSPSLCGGAARVLK
jgi:hypothetical protein